MHRDDANLEPSRIHNAKANSPNMWARLRETFNSNLGLENYIQEIWLTSALRFNHVDFIIQAESR